MTFIWTTVLATQPGLLVFSYVGSLLTSLSDIDGVMGKNPKRYQVAAVLIACSVVTTLVFITCISRRAWRDTMRRMVGVGEGVDEEVVVDEVDEVDADEVDADEVDDRRCMCMCATTESGTAFRREGDGATTDMDRGSEECAPLLSSRSCCCCAKVLSRDGNGDGSDSRSTSRCTTNVSTTDMSTTMTATTTTTAAASPTLAPTTPVEPVPPMASLATTTKKNKKARDEPPAEIFLDIPDDNGDNDDGSKPSVSPCHHHQYRRRHSKEPFTVGEKRCMVAVVAASALTCAIALPIILLHVE